MSTSRFSKSVLIFTLLISLLVDIPANAAPIPRLVIPRLGHVWDVGLLPWVNRTWPTTTLGVNVDRLDTTGDFTVGSNTVLAGHYTLADGSRGAFYELHRLTIGDYVWIDIGQSVSVYQVGAVFSVQPDAMWVTRPVDGKTTLTLITCDDYDTVTRAYSKRLIVWAFEVTNA